MKLTIKLFFVLSLMIVTLSCKKQVAGPKGEAGQDGKNGNANQQLIEEFTLLSQDWFTNTVKKDWNASISTNLMTQKVLDAGSVEMYVKVNSQWMRLPYTRDDFHFQYKLALGVIGVNYFKSHGVANQPESLNFKVIIVSPKE